MNYVKGLVKFITLFDKFMSIRWLVDLGNDEYFGIALEIYRKAYGFWRSPQLL